MVEKLPKRIVIALLVLIVIWWLWPTGDDSLQVGATSLEQDDAEQLVSSIQPISGADAASQNKGSLQGQLRDAGSVEVSTRSAPDERLVEQFGLALELIVGGNQDQAIDRLKAIIEEYPRVVEPYINLASLYSESGQLQLASDTLSKAMQANSNTATLFTSVQKVYGAQAAKAYQTALNEEGLEQSKLILPTISSLDTGEAKADIIQTLQLNLAQAAQTVSAVELQKESLQSDLNQLKASIANTSSNREAEQKLITDQKSSLSDLQAQLEQAEQRLVAQRSAHQRELNGVREQLVAQTQLAKVASARGNALLANAQQQDLAAEQARLSAERKTIAEKRERDLLARQAADQLAQQATQQRRDQEKAANTASLANAQDEEILIGLVKSWAASWSAQNVAAYTSHYSSRYTPPGSSLSHAQWLEQRRVRLTNKKFIDVDVSAFSVSDMGDRVAITFTQHYRSNTVDDRIRKRLVFEKNGNDLSNAKIVNERVTSS